MKAFSKTNSEHLSTKVFVAFALLIFFVSLCFSVFFIQHQNRSLFTSLVQRGELFSSLLAYNVRLGVFSENADLLKDPVGGVFNQEGVHAVSVFNLEGKPLWAQQKAERNAAQALPAVNEAPEKIPQGLKEARSSLHMESAEAVVIWAPVRSGAAYAAEESLFFEKPPFRSGGRVIGFVRITLDKSLLHAQRNRLLAIAVLIFSISLAVGSVLAYLVVKEITRPLKRLTDGVKSFDGKGALPALPVETRDEIGRLAEAFNNMSASLKLREEEKRQLEAQLRHAQKMEAIGTLSGGIAHDFNNILTAIMGYGSIMLMEIHEEGRLRRNVQQIMASAEKAAQLVRNLLVFSRKQLFEPRPVNLNEDIKNLKKLIARLIREDIEMRFALAEEELVVVVDPGQLDQALMNLATNARDAMPDGGILTISTARVVLDKDALKGSERAKPGHYALLSVSDTGMGMDEETKQRIFDPFFTTKEIGKGTGLGLSMIYGFVTQHEGLIDVASQPGQGSTFRIHLPLCEAKSVSAEARPKDAPQGGNETLLLAEDDESVRALGKEILERAGYRVIEAVDGEDAVAKYIAHREAIRLALLDAVMPRMRGKEAYREMLMLQPDLKAVFISGYAPDMLSGIGMVDEGIDFLSKPVSQEALLKKVREVLDR